MTDKKNTTQALAEGKETPKLQGADDLALAALSQASPKSDIKNDKTEVEQSDEFATTLHSLESVIESKANALMNLKNKMKQKREMINNVLENDSQLQEVSEQKAQVAQQVKELRNNLNESVQMRQLRDDLREFKDEQTDLEESLSNHLVNYHQLTNSTSFDTSDGDQWEFQIRARVKMRKTEE